VEQPSGGLAHVAEALDGDGGALEPEAEPARRVLDGVQDAAAGRVGAAGRPADRRGLPVTTPGTEWPACIEIGSMNQAMTWALVPTSGAGMSRSGPTSGSSSVAKRRVTASSSLTLIERGSQATPPCAPPNGTSTSAHFQVIHIASARTSSMSAWGWKRIPPFAGPRATLCWTR
jgi:hypothetical protein